MANVPITLGGYAGSSSDDCTGAKSQALKGYTFITNDSGGEPVEGDIVTRNDSGNTTLTSDENTKSFPDGYYANAHGAKVTMYNGEWG